MTEELFREDAYARRTARPEVVAAQRSAASALDRTVFYSTRAAANPAIGGASARRRTPRL